MNLASIRALAAALLVAGAVPALPREAAVTAQTITTCQAVGCFGGAPGCYWYQAPDIQNIVLCYGSRP